MLPSALRGRFLLAGDSHKIASLILSKWVCLHECHIINSSLLSSAHNLCKQFGPRSGLTESKQIDTLIMFLSEAISWKNLILKKSLQATTKAWKPRIVFLRKNRCLPLLGIKKSQIALSYITRGIIWKIYMQELWFLCMTRSLNVLYKCMKFRWNTSNGYQVIERTRNSILNDQKEITPKISKAELWFCAWHCLIVL